MAFFCTGACNALDERIWLPCWNDPGSSDAVASRFRGHSSRGAGSTPRWFRQRSRIHQCGKKILSAGKFRGIDEELKAHILDNNVTVIVRWSLEVFIQHTGDGHRRIAVFPQMRKKEWYNKII